jgi:hypothetical protein
MSQPINVPEGLEFLDLVWKMEDAFEQLTDEQLPKMGVKAPQCLKHLGTVLSLLERVASCYWECPGGDHENHTIHYLAGRANSLARASLRLLRFGFYDESLSLTRSIGEIANLLLLFHLDPSQFEEWKSCNHKDRINKFGAGHVRKRITERGSRPPMDKDRYDRLCEVVTHPTAQTRPQAYNRHKKAMLGAWFQEAGLLIALNELSAMVAIVTLFAAILVNLKTEQLKYVKYAALALAKALGGVSVLNVSEMLDKAGSETIN